MILNTLIILQLTLGGETPLGSTASAGQGVGEGSFTCPPTLTWELGSLRNVGVIICISWHPRTSVNNSASREI